MTEKKQNAPKRSGFCLLAGRSNSGKSTLINALVGTKIAITSPKAQTTRFPIRGILTRDEGQVVFVDAPGLFQMKASNELTKRVNEAARKSFAGVDVIVYVVDPTRPPGKEENLIHNLILKSPAKKILAINKIDLKETTWKEEYLLDSEEFDDVVEISAWAGKNLKALINSIFSLLPFGEPLYPGGQFSDMPHETWLAELIREKIFLALRQEIPYSINVKIEKAEERQNGVYFIEATIETSNTKHKSIIIGRGGRMLKQIGSMARRELEGVLQKKVFLSLEVCVNKHWQSGL